MRCERIDTERERSTMEAHIQSTTIAVLGGTGKEGKGLALRWAAKGHEVIIGSRDATRAQATADEIRIRAGNNARVRGADNASAAQEASIIVLAVPYSAQLATAQEVAAQLTGKVLIDVTVPLAPPKVDRVQLPPGGSAVLALQEKLGAQVKVVSAFQNVSAGHLWDLEHVIECDVLVCGDDADAREAAVRLAGDAGMKGWHAGVLANSAAAEALTSVLIAINKRYKIPGSGLRITGTPAR
jgi:NADPH-dependent F420 reductase